MRFFTGGVQITKAPKTKKGGGGRREERQSEGRKVGGSGRKMGKGRRRVDKQTETSGQWVEERVEERVEKVGGGEREGSGTRVKREEGMGMGKERRAICRGPDKRANAPQQTYA